MMNTSPCPVDLCFDLDEVLSSMMDVYSTGRRTNEVNCLISQLPTLILMNDDGTEASDEKICAICRDDFSTGQEGIGRQLACRHIYHDHCIASWLALDSSCPLCRCVLIPKPTGRESM